MALTIGGGAIVDLSAYSNVETHPLLTARAIRLLIDSDNYDELGVPDYSQMMESGVANEDVPSVRGAIHFYNPRTHRGLRLVADAGANSV